MNWILDNLQIVIAVAAAIAYWLNQRAREKAGEEADYDEDGVPENRPAPRADARELSPSRRDGGDLDQEERARRIREEIQRKIAERRRGQTPGQASEAPPPPLPRFDPFRPVFQEEVRPVAAPPSPPDFAPARAEAAAYGDSAALDRQRRMAEELEQLEERRREARRLASQTRAEATTVVTAVPASVGGRAALGARGVAAELRDPRALRRAIVLREVLSAPVALR
jgi:hypothetical protein